MGVEDAVEAAFRVLAARPSALVSDIDGTLSPIVARPADARVSERARDGVQRLVSLLDTVAIITGREEGVARAMVGVPGLSYIGSYALGAGDVGAKRPGGVAAALEAARPLLVDTPCVQLDEKDVSFALHFRNCDDPPSMRLRLLSIATPLAERYGAKLLEGKQVIEVAPGDLPSKGQALAGLLREKQAQGAVFIGDDLADTEAFRELHRRTDEQGLPSLAVAVVDAETHPAVVASADVALQGVPEVEAFLDLLAQGLETGARGLKFG